MSGNANNSVNNEAFYLNANNDSGNANQNIGGQLRLLEKMFCSTKTLPLGKTQSKTPLVLVGYPERSGVK